MDQFTPSVVPRLVLRKTAGEHLKFGVKETAARVGLDIRGWRAIREAFNSGLAEEARNPRYLKEERLSDADVERLTEWSERSLEDYKAQLVDVPDDRLAETIQYQIVPLADWVIGQHDNVTAAVDVGAHYARLTALLARRHPAVTWDLLDFPRNLAEVNADIATDRMRFHSCYPLAWLESRSEPIDLCLFNRVFCVVTLAEFRRYLAVLKPKCRFIVFNEAAKILMQPSNLDVDAIDGDQPHKMPGWRIHNYRQVFTDAGYKLLHYDAVRTSTAYSGDLHFVIRGIAVADDG